MKSTLILATALTGSLLAGCGEVHHSHHDSYYEETETRYVAVYDEPEITFLEVVDTYGISSEESPDIVFNPYEDDGWFQINWNVDTRDDYIVEYYVNDVPYLAGSVLIDEERCGPGLSCDYAGLQFCRYGADLSMECDADTQVRKSIGHKIFTLPQSLYFIFQVCSPDLHYCEYIAQEFIAE